MNSVLSASPLPRDVDLPALGSRIEKLRKELRWSRRVLAERSGLRGERIANVEAGRARVLLDEAVRLSSALNQPLSVLVFGEAWAEEELAIVAARRGLRSEQAELLLEAVTRGLEILKAEGRVS